MSSPQFLYPTSRQFPFDETCSQIVTALERRNWKVPGMTVTFHNYGSGAQKLRAVAVIEGLDFRLRFSRTQGTLPGGRWNDMAAVREVSIPKKELHVYEDESGPRLTLYVGDNWERDRQLFRDHIKINSKLRNEPKMYLTYNGHSSWRGQRPQRLKHTNDIGREYDPTADEPTFFDTNALMLEISAYLQDVVLPAIEAHPVAEKIEIPPPPEILPFPSNTGPIFCLAAHQDVARIRQGKKDVTELELANQYSMIGGYRLLPLYMRNDGTISEIAYDGFLWCGLGELLGDKAILNKPIDQLVPGHMRGSYENFVLRVTPKCANEIYVADHGAYEKRRAELAAAINSPQGQRAGRLHFTDEEIADFTRARARTIVPISEYQGGFSQPLILINRELDFDEVEIIGDEWPR